LFRCNGLISNAGFHLPAGAFFLGKKILCRPLIGPPEPGFNADTLKKLHPATICVVFTKSGIGPWIRPGRAVGGLYYDTMVLMIDMILHPTPDFSSSIFGAWIPPSCIYLVASVLDSFTYSSIPPIGGSFILI
jgi:hypothetical protein